ncbi:MAG: hypothetical protein U0S13_08190 [Mycobacterium sp.]
MSEQNRFVVKWYTRASRVRIVIAKFDGRWTIPGGPYPIPEIVTLVGGLLVTLFALPRTGQPLLTIALGLGSTAIAVGVMRQMPYSPVRFATRVHRLVRLYTTPVSISSGADMRSVASVSVVRSPVVFLSDSPAAADPMWSAPPRRRPPAPAAPSPAPALLGELFDEHRSPAAGLFG